MVSFCHLLMVVLPVCVSLIVLIKLSTETGFGAFPLTNVPHKRSLATDSDSDSNNLYFNIQNQLEQIDDHQSSSLNTPKDEEEKKQQEYGQIINNFEIKSESGHIPVHCNHLFSKTGIPASFDVISDIFIDKTNQMSLPLDPNIVNITRLKYLCALLAYYDQDYHDKQFQHETGLITNISQHLKQPNYTAIGQVFDNIFKFRIFQIGFNKVGTQSLDFFFKANNVPSAHWTISVYDMFNNYQGSLVQSIENNAKFSDFNTGIAQSRQFAIAENIISSFERNVHETQLNQWSVQKQPDFTKSVLNTPWYLQTFMFYSDFGVDVYSEHPIFTFYFEYKCLSAYYGYGEYTNNLNQMTNRSTPAIGVDDYIDDTYEIIMRLSLLTNFTVDYQTATFYKMLDISHNHECYFILNIRNVYHWLLSRAHHENGLLLQTSHKTIESFATRSDWLRRESILSTVERHTGQRIEIKYIDVIRAWYLQWYSYICNAVKYFDDRDQSDHKKLILFDVELDPIQVLTEYFKDVINLDPQKWDHWHKTSTGKNRLRLMDEYDDVVEKLQNIINRQQKENKRYSEKQFIMTSMCPRYFWNENNVFKYQFYEYLGNRIDKKYKAIMNWEKWNAFYGYLADNHTYENDF